MDTERKHLLKRLIALGVLAALAYSLGAAEFSKAGYWEAEGSPRRVETLTTGWEFSLDAFKTSKRVTLPHSIDEGEVAPCTAEASLRRVHCRRQPEAMTRPQVASRSEVARGLRASVCAATPRRGSLLYAET